jgi:hypothetical protein
MNEPKNYASGQVPAAGDICVFKGQEAGGRVRVDALDANGWVMVGFTSINPEELVFVKASEPGAAPLPAPPPNGFAHVARPATPAPAPAPVPVPLASLDPLDALARLRTELATCRVKLKPQTKDHVQGSAIARRLADVILVLDQMLIIFPELAAAAAKKAKRPA